MADILNSLKDRLSHFEADFGLLAEEVRKRGEDAKRLPDLTAQVKAKEAELSRLTAEIASAEAQLARHKAEKAKALKALQD